MVHEGTPVTMQSKDAEQEPDMQFVNSLLYIFVLILLFHLNLASVGHHAG